jgi:hypothetical protein
LSRIPRDRCAQIAFERFVRTQKEDVLLFKPEDALAQDMCDRRAGRQAHHARHAVADVVGPRGDLGVARPNLSSAKTHAYARRAAERAHRAHKGVRPIGR